MIRIAVDAMGGDRAPSSVVEGSKPTRIEVSFFFRLLVGEAPMATVWEACTISMAEWFDEWVTSSRSTASC